MEKQLETVMKENQALREVQKGQLTKSKSVYLFIYDIYIYPFNCSCKCGAMPLIEQKHNKYTLHTVY